MLPTELRNILLAEAHLRARPAARDQRISPLPQRIRCTDYVESAYADVVFFDAAVRSEDVDLAPGKSNGHELAHCEF